MPKSPLPHPQLIKTKRAQTFLRAWRKHTKLSQEEAASQFGIDRTTLGRIERAIIPYNQDMLERAAIVYGCSPHDLLSVDPLKPNVPDLVCGKIRAASPEMQRRALDIIEALLRNP